MWPHHLHGLGSRAVLAACTVLARLCCAAASIIHAYICISARQALLYPMHAVPCWSSPGTETPRLSGATQLWSQNHCNYVTALLPQDCLAKLRSCLQDGLAGMTSCSDIAAVHRGVARPCSQPAPDLSIFTQLAPVSSWPAVAAVPPSLAPQGGHRSACQPEQDAFALLPAAHLCPGCGRQSRARPRGWAELGIFLP